MLVKDAMTGTVVTIGPGHTLRQASEIMTARKVGSVIVLDPDQPGAGILTERDIVRAVAAKQDPDMAIAADHLTFDAAYAAPAWTLTEATEAMRRGGFRHLVVVEGDQVVGIISMRDVVHAWAAVQA